MKPEVLNVLNKLKVKAQASHCDFDVWLEMGEDFSASIQDGQPEKLQSGISQSAGFRVLLKGFEGYAQTEDLSAESLERCYEKAFVNAKVKSDFLGEPEFAAEIPAPTVPEQKDLGLFFREPQVSIENKIVQATMLEQLPRQLDSRVKSVAMNKYSERERERFYFNSKGFSGTANDRFVMAYCVPLVEENAERREGWRIRIARQRADLNCESIAREATQLAIESLGAKPPPSGSYPVLFSSRAAAEFLGLFVGHFSAKTLAEKSSLFQNALGSTIASSVLTVTDNPLLVGGLGSRLFDGEGSASQVTPVVQNGQFKNWLSNYYYARKMGLTNTANAQRSSQSELSVGASNWVISPGTESRESLLKRAPQVLLIDRWRGLHFGVNQGSGDFSLPADGFFYENGKRKHAASDFVVAGNFKNLLRQIVAVGEAPKEVLSNIVAPDLLIDGLSIAAMGS